MIKIKFKLQIFIFWLAILGTTFGLSNFFLERFFLFGRFGLGDHFGVVISSLYMMEIFYLIRLKI